MLIVLLGFGRGPDFLVIGAQKAGTTSLYQYIQDLGVNFQPPEQKEFYYFTENYDKGLFYYKSKFPLFRSRNILSGEATPDYLLYPLAPVRVKKHFPNIKIVVVLRDPVDRAYSQYRFQNHTDRTHAYDPLPFTKAVLQEPERYTKSDILNFRESFKYYSYVERGRYAKQLKRWFGQFPESRILVMELNEIKNNPDGEINRLFSFLGLNRNNRSGYSFTAANKSPGGKNLMPLSAANYLQKQFAEENEDLYSLLGKRFDWSKSQSEEHI